ETTDEDQSARAFPVSETNTIGFDPELVAENPRVLVADYDGDGREDMIVSSRDASTLRILRQSKTGALIGETVPVFQGVEYIVPLKADRGEPTPLVLFSSDEKAVGFARYDKKSQTLPFPSILPINGKPRGVAIPTAGDSDSDQQLVVAMEGTDGS